MVEKFKIIAQEIEKENGEITIFALLKMDEFIDKWTILFCSKWATKEKRSEVFNILRNKIIDGLTKEELNEIGRLAIYTEDEHLVQELLKYKSGSIIENTRINGNMVHYANIIVSKNII